VDESRFAFFFLPIKRIKRHLAVRSQGGASMKRKYISGLHRENGDIRHFSMKKEDGASVQDSKPKVITWKKVTKQDGTIAQNWHTRLNEYRLGRGDGQF
jgi:hypothetical protein